MPGSGTLIVADIMRALRAAENVDRIVVPAQKPVRAEIAARAYGWRCCRARSPLSMPELAILFPWLDADSAIRTEHTRNLVVTVGDTRKLLRPAGHCQAVFLHQHGHAEGAADWRWHSFQWQAAKRIGSVVNT
jgi:hypothetical protein